MNKSEQKMKQYCYELALQMATQAWCSEKNKHKTMDYELNKEFARLAANWIETAMLHLGEVGYYKGLLEECGEAIGTDAYTQDDGNVVEDVLVAKIPELVKEMVERIEELEAMTHD